MKTAIFACVFTMISAATVAQASDEKSLTLEQLNSRSIIGQLGVPLGTATEIRAQIVAGRAIDKAGTLNDSYYLKVTHVAGKEIAKPPICKFSIPSHRPTKLAANMFDLYHIKKGKPARALLPDQIEEIEKGYVGRTLPLTVYETGRYSGFANSSAIRKPKWKIKQFKFSTSLIILEEPK